MLDEQMFEYKRFAQPFFFSLRTRRRSWRIRSVPITAVIRAPATVAISSATASGVEPSHHRKLIFTESVFWAMKTISRTSSSEAPTVATQAPLVREWRSGSLAGRTSVVLPGPGSDAGGADEVGGVVPSGPVVGSGVGLLMVTMYPCRRRSDQYRDRVDEPDLLIRHAATWAGQKKRALDGELLKEVVELRLRHDDYPLGTWPAGSAERLLLVTWPAYGSELPDQELLRDTLDTFWGFLRATGRMSTGSASPAELRKEARRALPKMAAAYDDPARHSQGRVLADFGRSVGIDLDGAASIEELQGRLDRIQEAWNALPQEERLARMPDASPKSLRGQQLTSMINQERPYPAWEYDESDGDDDEQGIEPGEIAVSARLARESAYLQQCLALADWVGSGRPATSRGLLRPAVAREAYQALDLWQWERAYDRLQHSFRGVEEELPPEADAVLAHAALHAWRSAGDCLPLDRLWFSCDHAGLVELTSASARDSGVRPDSDEGWRNLALVALVALCLRLGWYTVEPMAGILLIATVAEEEWVPVDAVRAWWDSRCPEQLRNFPALGWQERLDLLWFHFADCNLWALRDDAYQLTDLGRDFAIAFLNALDDGLLGED